MFLVSIYPYPNLTGSFAQNVDRENSNKIKQEEGALAVARIKAQAQNVSPSPWI